MSEDEYSIYISTGYWVTLLAKSMEQYFEKRLEVHGVTRATYALLIAIYQDKKTTPAALAKFIGIDGAAITRHLDRIEERGLIFREQNSTDRRSVNLKLSPEGLKLVPKVIADSKATNKKFLSGLSKTEIDSFQQIIRKMLSNGKVIPGDI